MPVKSVLENLCVYWISMAQIPKSTLGQIQNRIFNFLWSSNKDKKMMHLVAWENLAQPKTYGGWGFNNIFLFGLALAANFLWRDLFSRGLLNVVIKDKYLR